MQPHRWQPTRLPRPWDSQGKNTGVGCPWLLQCMKVKNESEVTQSCLTLHDHMDCSLPGSSVHGIFQARVLEWVAIAFSSIWDEKANIIFLRHYIRFLSGIWIHIKLVCNKIKVGYEWVWHLQVQTVPSSKGETPVPPFPFPDWGHSLASLSRGWVLF